MGRPDLSRSSQAAPAVTLDEAPLTAAHIVAIAHGARIELGPVARHQIAAARAVVDRLVAGDELIYGLNTGLGHARNERLALETLAENQVLTVREHAGGIGPDLPGPIVRAAMAVRLAGIARGGSGASSEMAETLAAMLNAGVTPVVPTTGSVGASDLMHMAAIALVAIGQGSAELDGRRLTGGAALSSAGIPPLRLAPKDGLTIISANGVSIGQAALVVDRASRLAAAADVVAALSMEAARANLSIVDPFVVAAKPVAGQAVVAARIRDLLEGSRLCVSAPSVQDPLSFRVTPQVHGAVREVVAFALAAIDGELAAMDDNPLVAVGDGRMISNGNFHPMLMALAMDAMRPAIAHLGQLSDRRAGHSWDDVANDPELFTPEGSARFGISPLIRYSGAARLALLRSLADPVSLDVGPLDLGVEDHATNAPLAVSRTDEALDVLADLLAIELLVAVGRIRWVAETRALMGGRMRTALELVERTIADLGGGASTATIHGAIRDLLAGSLQATVERAGLDRSAAARR